ncbi:ribonuclease HI [Methylophilaceae bacterium]|jgi:ribonuclease HI|nr:ribonuclease HI [Methylophilaceae bacterium]|tara:strand:- start:1866 stop:2303 length:438 start_codon:yes stop_codon:yes gene_type:complete
MINIYTDGACKGNPGDGGWGALIIDGDAKNEIFGGEADTTNNRMEIMAVIMALKTLNTESKITIYTDSTYVQKGISEWIDKWKINGWRTSNKKDVKNKDLWIELDSLTSKFIINWTWIKGHSGHPENDRADYLANKGVIKDESIL